MRDLHAIALPITELDFSFAVGGAGLNLGYAMCHETDESGVDVFVRTVYLWPNNFF